MRYTRRNLVLQECLCVCVLTASNTGDGADTTRVRWSCVLFWQLGKCWKHCHLPPRWLQVLLALVVKLLVQVSAFLCCSVYAKHFALDMSMVCLQEVKSLCVSLQAKSLYVSLHWNVQWFYFLQTSVKQKLQFLSKQLMKPHWIAMGMSTTFSGLVFYANHIYLFD